MQLSVERNVGPEMNDFFVLLLFIMHVYLPICQGDPRGLLVGFQDMVTTELHLMTVVLLFCIILRYA